MNRIDGLRYSPGYPMRGYSEARVGLLRQQECKYCKADIERQFNTLALVERTCASADGADLDAQLKALVRRLRDWCRDKTHP